MSLLNLNNTKFVLPIFLIYVLVLQLNAFNLAKYFICLEIILILINGLNFNIKKQDSIYFYIFLIITNIFILCYPILVLDDIYKMRNQLNIILIAIFSMNYGFYVGSSKWENFSLNGVKYYLVIAIIILLVNQLNSIFFNININRLTTTHICFSIFIINSCILLRYKTLYFSSFIYTFIFVIAFINNSKNLILLASLNIAFYYIFSKKKIIIKLFFLIQILLIFELFNIINEFNWFSIFHDLCKIIQYQYLNSLSGKGLLAYENFQEVGISHTLFTRASYFFEAIILLIKFPFGFGYIGDSFQYAQIAEGVNIIAPGQVHSAILDLALCYGIFIIPLFFAPLILIIFRIFFLRTVNYNFLFLLAFNFLGLSILTESSYGLFFGYILSLFGFLIGSILKKL